jgi:4-aminobutyrate aminotransferase/(S)-3-amino-2-methylpropionate transaminase
MKRRRDKAIPRSVYNESAVCPVFIRSAKNAILEDIDGNRFIDFAGGIGVLNTGHNHPKVVAAARRQMDALVHTCFSVVMYEPMVSLAERLNSLTPGRFEKKTYFGNSGTEAVEKAVKAARHYTKRPGIVAFEHAFHGRTMLALSLTWKKVPYKEGYGPFVPDVHHLPFPYSYRRPEGFSENEYEKYCAETVRNYLANNPDTGCLVMEPILGEGGIVVPSKDFVKAVAKACAEHDTVFIADEIQTGFCRTGKMFASEWFGLEPDIMTTAKAMAGGFPISAFTGRKEIMDSAPTGGEGGTFGGNPVSCAAALATIDVMQKEKLAQKALKIGSFVEERFNRLVKTSPIVGEARGIGAMRGLEIVEDKDSKKPGTKLTEKIIEECFERGVIMYHAGTWGSVVRLLPPLTIPIDQLKEGLDVVEEVVEEAGE